MTIQERVLITFNDLHTMPELGLQEEKTSAYLAQKLKEFGYDVKTNIAVTGVIGTLKSPNPGPTVAIRGDMDALGHLIDGKLKAIHSCGHDAHSSMVLAAAEALIRKGISRGTLKIVFQPAEETLLGAKYMVESGELNDIDRIFGLHLRPIQEARTGQMTPALYHGASCILKAHITGKTAHGARPHLGVNAINAAVSVIQAVNAIATNPLVPSSVKATQIQGGGPVANSIPESTVITFDVRSQKNETMAILRKQIQTAIENAAAASGAKGHLDIIGEVPAAEYDAEMIELAKEAIIDTMGNDALMPPITTPGGEDFHFYAQLLPNVQAVYLGLGCDLTPGLHDPNMTFNKDALEMGAKVLVCLAEKSLEKA